MQACTVVPHIRTTLLRKSGDVLLGTEEDGFDARTFLLHISTYFDTKVILTFLYDN